MGPKSSKNNGHIDQVLSGGVLTETKKIVWKIDQFEFIRQSENLIKMQKFRFTAGETFGLPSEWCCYLSAENVRVLEVEKKTVGIYLKLEKALARYQNVNAKWKVKIGSNVIRNYSVSTSYGWRNFVSREFTQKLPLVKGCLEIELELTLVYPKVSSAASLHHRQNSVSQATTETMAKEQIDLRKEVNEAVGQRQEVEAGTDTEVGDKPQTAIYPVVPKLE